MGRGCVIARSNNTAAASDWWTDNKSPLSVHPAMLRTPPIDICVYIYVYTIQWYYVEIYWLTLHCRVLGYYNGKLRKGQTGACSGRFVYFGRGGSRDVKFRYINHGVFCFFRRLSSANAAVCYAVRQRQCVAPNGRLRSRPAGAFHAVVVHQ